MTAYPPCTTNLIEHGLWRRCGRPSVAVRHGHPNDPPSNTHWWCDEHAAHWRKYVPIWRKQGLPCLAFEELEQFQPQQLALAMIGGAE